MNTKHCMRELAYIWINYSSMKKQMSVKERIYEIIFESDTSAGKLFDVSLLILIFISVLTVILESVDSLHSRYASLFFIVDGL